MQYYRLRIANLYLDAIISCRSLLVSNLQNGNLDSLADSFYEKGIICQEECDRIQSTHEKEKKARCLVHALENKVKSFPTRNYYKVFIEMLADKYQDYQTLIVALESKITEFKLEEGIIYLRFKQQY